MKKIGTDSKNIGRVCFKHAVHSAAELLHKFHVFENAHDFPVTRAGNSACKLFFCHSVNQSAV